MADGSQNARGPRLSSDDTTPIALCVAVIAFPLYGWLLWTALHAEISWLFAHAAYWHIRVIGLFTNDYNAFGAQLLASDHANTTFAELVSYATAIGWFFRVPAAALLAGLGVLCFVRAAPNRFTRRFDLDGLIREQARTFRTAAVVVERKLGIVAPRAGTPRPADPALHAGEWIERFATAPNGRFDEARNRLNLSAQLGPRWSGVEAAAPHVRVLCAAFALHLAQRRQDVLDLLGDMSEGLAPLEPGEGAAGPENPLPFPPGVAVTADRWLSDPALADPVTEAMKGHAYTAPACMTLLHLARQRGGSLPPTLFVGLKLVDRPLWYALHSLGFPPDAPGQHPNPRVEAIASRDHWASECVARCPLPVPSIERAVSAVRAAAADTAASANLAADTAASVNLKEPT